MAFSFAAKACGGKTVAAVVENFITQCRGPRKTFDLYPDDPYPIGDEKIRVYFIQEKTPPPGWSLESITCPGIDEDRWHVQLAKRRVFVKPDWVNRSSRPECVFHNTTFTLPPPSAPVQTMAPPPPPPPDPTTTTRSPGTTTTTNPRARARTRATRVGEQPTF